MYKGRFTPSPTGPRHFGSLVAALASYLDAHAARGEWLVRIEDLDTPRNVPGADVDILRTLEIFALEWDGPVLCQSARTEAYREALNTLKQDNKVYPCSCSRREACGAKYPGTCRNSPKDPAKPCAWRVRTDDGNASDDFIVRRSNGVFAYQLAVVVDDAAQSITDVVRGADLCDSTPRQLYLQALLNLPHPNYLHVPVVNNVAGEKLSKQTQAPALDRNNPTRQLKDALRFLNQREPESATPAAILQNAVANWNPDALRE